jgi:hypothetical protein
MCFRDLAQHGPEILISNPSILPTWPPFASLEDWVPDFEGQTGEQKTHAHAREKFEAITGIVVAQPKEFSSSR